MRFLAWICFGVLVASTAHAATRSVTSADTIQAADCGNTIASGGNALYTVTLPAASSVADGCIVRLVNVDAYTGPGTGRGKLLSGFPSDLYRILFPKQAAAVEAIGGAWVTIRNPGRWIVPQQVTVCIDTSGSDTAGDGLAGSSGLSGCMGTPQGAAMMVWYRLDHQGQSPIICFEDGETFAGEMALGGQPAGNNVVLIQPCHGSAYTWNNSGDCVSAGDNAEFIVYGPVNFNCNSADTAGQAALYAHNNAIFDLFGSGIVFNGNGVNDSAIFCDGICIGSVANGFTITGTMGDIVHMDEGGKISASGVIGPQGASAPTAARLFGLHLGARLILGGQPATGGYTSLGPSVVDGNSVLATHGYAVPGGSVQTSYGGQVM